MRLFVVDLTATQAAQVTDLNRNTINRIYQGIRKRIALACEVVSPFNGEIEVDDSYIGARRVRGVRDCGTLGKAIVFGLIKRQDAVFTELVPNCSKATLQGIIRRKVSLESVIHSDCWRGYDGLVDLGYQKHCRVRHGEN